jgi:hypothetical protein
MGSNVFDDHTFAEERGGAARARGRSDGETIEVRNEFGWKTRRSAVANAQAVLIEQEDRAEHPIGLLLDEPYEAGENLTELFAPCDPLKDATLPQLEPAHLRTVS